MLGWASMLVAISLAGCHGSLHVSHPQVHTRERLVDQRLRESQWLRKQLDKSDEIETTYQGLRDFREFVGLYGEVAAAVNPAHGRLDSLTNDARELELKTLLWKQRQSELNARLGYFKDILESPKTFLPDNEDGEDADSDVGNQEGSDEESAAGESSGEEDGDDGGSGSESGVDEAGGDNAGEQETGGSNSGGGNSTGIAANNSGAAPSVSAPYGMKPSDITLPDPSKLVETKAKAHPLDLFRDKLAYRDAVNAAIRSNQLDDSHDFAGQMLYELTLSLALAPGTDNQRFGEVILEFAEPECLSVRAGSLARLYDKWVGELHLELVGDVFDLQHRITDANLSENQKGLLAWFVTRFGPALAVQLGQVREELYACGGMLDGNVAIRELRGVGGVRGMVEHELLLRSSGDNRKKLDFEKAANALRELLGYFYKVDRPSIEEILNNPSEKDKVCLRKAAAWAVWGRHYIELQRIVGISWPRSNVDGFLDGGLEVESVKAFTRNKKLLRGAPAWLKGRICRKRPSWMESSDSGVVTFIKRLHEAEKQPHALDVQPMEHAQSISEAAARESMLNMLMAVNAMLPNTGVNSNIRGQYVRRAQTYLHAITRQPLLVGFGQGERRFGWFLGPAFQIKNGKASFVQRVVRHDVSAEIVVPAWRDQISLTGRQAWLDHWGNPGISKKLWNGNKIKLNLRIPEDASRHITQALLANSIAGGRFRRTSRPYPIIEFPSKSPEHVVPVQSVRAGVTDPLPQYVLILGNHLWRNPQVFIGSVKADTVEVLSDMRGIQAHFHNIPYPGTMSGVGSRIPISQDLTVVTSFGKDKRHGVISVLPPIDLPKPKQKPVKLSRTYVDDQSTQLSFVVDRPESYGAFRIALKAKHEPAADYEERETTGKWSTDNKQIAFDLIERKGSELIHDVQLRFYPRPDTKGGMMTLNEGGESFAWFASTRDRSARLKETAVEFDKDGKPDKSLTFMFDPEMLNGIHLAYPGSRESFVAGKAVVRLAHEDHSATVPLTIVRTEDPAILAATVKALEAESKKLLAKELVGKPLRVSIRYSRQGGMIEIPVINDGKPATLTITQKGMKATPPFVVQDKESVTFEAGKSSFEDEWELILKPADDGGFDHKQSLDNLLNKTDKSVTVIAEDATYGLQVKLVGKLSKQGKAYVVTVVKALDDDARAKLLEWSSNQGVVISRIVMETHASPIDVKNTSGEKAIVGFSE